MFKLASIVTSISLLAAASASAAPSMPEALTTTSSLHHPASDYPTAGSAAEAVVLPPATLGTVTGAINWGKVGCWTAVVVVGVSASAASGGGAAAASIALAGVCLILF